MGMPAISSGLLGRLMDVIIICSFASWLCFGGLVEVLLLVGCVAGGCIDDEV